MRFFINRFKEHVHITTPYKSHGDTVLMSGGTYKEDGSDDDRIFHTRECEYYKQY